MKITSNLNNIFDQYTLEENRVTNAFLQTLAKNNTLLKDFLARHLKISIGEKSNIIVSSQKKPSALGDLKDDKGMNAGIPDGWIIIDEDKAIVFESKITRKAIKRNQLLSHVKKIKVYNQKYLCVITPDERSPIENIKIPNADIKWIPWCEIYKLVSENKESQGLSGYLRDQFKEYLIMKKGLVGFQGIDYPSGSFNPDEAKIILKNLTEEIKPDVLKVYPKLEFERKSYFQNTHAYTIDQTIMWSTLGADKESTKDIHLTFWLAETHMGIGLTIPNNAGKRWKRLKEIFKNDDIFNTFVKQLFRLRDELPNVYLEFIHRHYLRRRRRDGITDGVIEMNLDTIEGNKKGEVKKNKEWLSSTRELIINKTKSYNGQFMIRTRFFYKKEMKTSAFKEDVLKAVRSFKKVYSYLLE